MTNYLELDADAKDILKEIGNIGTGNAISALSHMIGKSFEIKLPDIRTIHYREAPELLGGPEKLETGIMLEISGGLSGMFLFLLNEEFTKKILDIMVGEEKRDLVELDEMCRSAICEVGNIMCGAYISALAQLMDLKVHVSIPDTCSDMIGAILSVPMIRFANLSDHLLFIENQFLMDNKTFLSHILFLPESESLHQILQVLGA